MKTLILFLLVLLIKICQATKFKVICAPREYNGDSVSVVIDGTSYPMSSTNSFYFTYDYEGTPSSYYYAVTSAGNPVSTENQIFGHSRTWEQKGTSTLNEVYGRKYSVGDSILKPMPRLYPKRESYGGFSMLFQEAEIPVIHVHMQPGDYTILTTDANGKNNEYRIDFDIYTPYDVYSFTNGTLELSGMGSRNAEKKPFEIKFAEEISEEDKSNSEIFDRTAIKLRNIYFDPTYIKNKLGIDISESLGLPVAQSGHARLYINNWPFGLYDLSETYKKKFIRNNFYYGKKKNDVVLGSYYKGVSGDYPAYLYPDPAELNQDLYNLQFAPIEYPDPYTDIIELQNWIASLTTTTSKSEIESKFDVDMYLKYMALEYLICHWDGYLINGNNYFVYREKEGKFYFMSFDFDLTLGRWCESGVNKNFDEYVKTFDANATYGPGPKREPALYNKLLLNTEIKEEFNKILKEVTENVFNSAALKDRILYFKEFLKDDVAWDISARQRIPTPEFEGNDKQNLWTLEDSQSFYDGMKGGNDLALIEFINIRANDVAKALGLSTASFKFGDKNGLVGEKLVAMELDNSKAATSVNSGSEDIISPRNLKFFLQFILSALVTLFLIIH